MNHTTNHDINHDRDSDRRPDAILPGLDALRAGGVGSAGATSGAGEVLELLRGRRIGLLTNHTGATRGGMTALDALREMGLDVRALFSPEHGFSGTREGHISSSEFENLPVHSLYGDTRRPTRAMLDGLEVLVCDLQDVGARFYTYSTTLAYCLEECAKSGVAVVVLDRPNPLGGEVIEGPNVEESARSFIGYLDVPIRHGLTLGELALLHKADGALDVELRVARVLGWRRAMTWPETKLNWPVPSPNLPDWQSAFWYPGVCLLEFSGLSVGRGTGAPFQTIGAPWMDATRVLGALQDKPSFAENFRAQTIEFTPTRGEHSDVSCRGLRFDVPHSQFHVPHSGVPHSSVPLGLCLLSALHRAQSEEFDEEKLRASLPLLGANGVLELLRAGEVEEAIATAERDAENFRARREPFLIYE